MANIEGPEGWTFNNCYASKTLMQVGSGSSPYTSGDVISPEIGIDGNAILLIQTSRINSIAARFQVSVIGNGDISSSEFTVGEGTYRPNAILIKGCTPSTKIKIQSTYGIFNLLTVKVYDIADAVFYESFNYMNYSKEGFAFSSSDDASTSSCDNYIGVDFSSTRLSKEKIFFNNNGSYKLPLIDIEDNSNAIMTFKVAKYPGSVNYPITVTGSGDVLMTQYNSTDLEDLSSSRTTNVIGEDKTWNNYSIILTNMSNTTKLTLSGRDIFLDDIKITPIPSGLDQSKDNSTYIIANSGQVRNVTLTRTITPNIWCPLCLPFSVTQAMMDNVLGTCELRTLGSVNASTGIFTFNSIAADATIEAGTPFLVKTSSIAENPTFSGVSIVNTPAKSETHGDYQFVGNYSPVYLQTDGTNLFLGTDGSLYQPGTEAGYNRLGGLRAYFVVPEKEAGARVAILDEPAETTSIKIIQSSTTHSVFDLLGRELKAKKFSPNLQIRDGRKILTK